MEGRLSRSVELTSVRSGVREGRETWLPCRATNLSLLLRCSDRAEVREQKDERRREERK